MAKTLVVWLSGGTHKGIDDQTRFAVALHRLFAVAPKGTAVLIAQTSSSEISPYLSEQLKNPSIKKVIIGQSDQTQATTDQLWEAALSKQVVVECMKILRRYDWIIYLDTPSPMASPLIFKYLEKFSGKDAIVGNPTPLGHSGQTLSVLENTYYPHMFAMKRDLFLKYIDALPNQDLYSFIHEHAKNHQEVLRWGLLGYDIQTNEMHII